MSNLRLVRNFTTFFFVFLGVLAVGTFYYIQFVLPDTEALKTVQLRVPLQIYTQDGKLIGSFGEQRRIPIPYEQIPKQLINAVLATEDQRYFQHPGVDLPGLFRAAVQLVLTGRKEQGGSTITMQVARSFYLNRNKTFGRKLREILLALKIENSLPKEKILELYLNKIFFGNRAYGVAAAAEVYYGRPLDQLTIDQYAMLAGIPKAPSTLNPLADEDAAKKRRDHVLARLYELHHIDEKTYKDALNTPLNASYHDLQVEIKAPYVAELVRQQAEQMYGESIYTDGYKIYTTITSPLQIAANLAVRSGLLAYDQRHGYRGAEQNLGVPDILHMEEVEKTMLANIPVVNSLEPAVVVDMGDQSIAVLRANGSLVTIPWEGLSWARRQIPATETDSNDEVDSNTIEETADNESDDIEELGPAPKMAKDILRVGDVIRLMQTDDGWRLAQLPKAEASLVAINPQDGSILALVGGFDYQSSKFNRVVSAERQPGSSFKPFIYSAALDKGFTLASVINDAPLVLENPDGSLWRPQNSNQRFYGPTRLHQAIVHSRNLVSIRLLAQIGISYAVKYAERFGFSHQQLPHGLSLALGTANATPLQMASAYAVFANGGFHTVPFLLGQIKNARGEVIYQAKPLKACASCEAAANAEPTAEAIAQASLSSKASPATTELTYAPRVISAQNAFLITSVLQDVIQHGTAMDARILKRTDLAGKTGTTNNKNDAWFAGYNKDLVVVTWLGFDQPQALYEYGAQAALPIWMKFMGVALHDLPEHPPEQPPGVVTVRIDPFSGRRTSATNPSAIFENFMTPYLPDTAVATSHEDLGDTAESTESAESSPRQSEDIY